jgi:hypothetical protein
MSQPCAGLVLVVETSAPAPAVLGVAVVMGAPDRQAATSRCAERSITSLRSLVRDDEGVASDVSVEADVVGLLFE